MVASCFIKSLDSGQLNGALVGWEKDELGDYIFPFESLKCCLGKGSYLEEHSNIAVRCSLKSRIARVETIMRSFYRQWGVDAEIPVESGRDSEAYFATWLAKKQTKGHVFSHRKTIDQPGMLWVFALTAAFRFNRQVVVIKVDKFKDKQLQKVLSLPLEDKAIICVEQVQHPNNPESAIILEEIISWAYHSAIPLWIELPKQANRLTMRQIHQSTLLGRVSSKINKKANQSLQHWIDPSSFSRLCHICQKSDQLLSPH